MKMTMNLYYFGKKGANERGACDIDNALAELEACYSRGLLHYEHAEEAIEKTSFGLSKTKEDFIEITCNGRDNVSIHSDRLHYSSRFVRMLALKGHYSICGPKAFAATVIRDYSEMDRKSFELKYSSYASR
jgi:hypothetical protein